MDDIKVEVEGLTELRRAFRKVDEDLPKELTAVHKKLAEMVVKDALPNVPVKTGRLLKTVKSLASQSKASAKAGTAKSVPYAPAVHWGTGPRPGLRGPHNIARKPFLWDALNRNQRRVEEGFEEAMDDLMEQAMRIARQS